MGQLFKIHMFVVTQSYWKWSGANVETHFVT